MAEDTDGVPIISCCPPGSYCPPESLCARPDHYNFIPKERMWFTLNFIHAVWLSDGFPGWSAELPEDDYMMVLRYEPFKDGILSIPPSIPVRVNKQLKYVWQLTGKRGGPDDFWYEGRWPD